MKKSKLYKVTSILLKVSLMDNGLISTKMKFYPCEDTLVYRFKCHKQDYDLEMLVELESMFNAKALLSFGKSFDNEYEEMTYKDFLKELEMFTA